MKTIFAYIVSHWRGEQSLARSLGINLVAVRLVISLFQERIVPDGADDFSIWRTQVVVYILVFHGLLALWQIVGVWRAAEKYLSNDGNISYYWFIIVALIIAFLMTISYALHAWRMTLPSPLALKERVRNYQFQLMPDNKIITVSGTLDPGVSRDLRHLLGQHQMVKQIVLSSQGGNIYEARGLAKMFMDHNLNTHVEGLCSSACTTAFIGGKKRTLGPSAKLGFHQYRIEANYSVTGFEPKKEQEKDKKIFLAQGVKPDFLQQMFNASPREMWFPTRALLQRSGVLN